MSFSYPLTTVVKEAVLVTGWRVETSGDYISDIADSQWSHQTTVLSTAKLLSTHRESDLGILDTDK